ncbi:MAG: hypothetical protein ABS949_11000 [Solibacillus sp.]
MDEQILVALKDNLQITWEDETTNRTLMRYITASKTFLNGLCETEFSFDEGSVEYELLLERCRYAWNNATDEYEPNFQRDLKRLILRTAVSKRKAGEEIEQTEGTSDVE